MQPGLNPYRVAQTHAPAAVHDEIRKQFDESDLVKLTLLVTMINARNRVAISFRSPRPVAVRHPAV
jgi:alkylhydroperoxidase family enzyme